MDKQPVVYILSNKRNGTIYVGVTSDLAKRITQHKEGQAEGFSSKYHLHTLVWYEYCETMTQAIEREKQLKDWNRAWKIRLIEKVNPYWNDLSEGFLEQ